MIQLTRSACIAILSTLAIAGCTKPKPPLPEPVTRDEPSAPTVRETPRTSEEELRRQRIRQEAAEIFRTVYFPLDQAALDPEARGILSHAARFMGTNPEVGVAIAGHCDERGTVEYNLALGERRAHAVSAYLTGLGVAATRIRAMSYGEERPAAVGSDEAAWKLNRRAELTPEFNF